MMSITITEYPIAVEAINSAGIMAECRRHGITHLREIGFGRSSGAGSEADRAVTFYALPDPSYAGSEIRVANTNADPVWEEEDASAFAALAEECGVAL